MIEDKAKDLVEETKEQLEELAQDKPEVVEQVAEQHAKKAEKLEQVIAKKKQDLASLEDAHTTEVIKAAAAEDVLRAKGSTPAGASEAPAERPLDNAPQVDTTPTPVQSAPVQSAPVASLAPKAVQGAPGPRNKKQTPKVVWSENVGKAHLKTVRITARKMRLVINLIRGKKLQDAVALLENTNKKASYIVKKLILSAAANAVNNHGLDSDRLWIKEIWANESVTMKRFTTKAKGSSARILKRTSHLDVVVAER